MEVFMKLYTIQQYHVKLDIAPFFVFFSCYIWIFRPSNVRQRRRVY